MNERVIVCLVVNPSLLKLKAEVNQQDFDSCEGGLIAGSTHKVFCDGKPKWVLELHTWNKNIIVCGLNYEQ